MEKSESVKEKIISTTIELIQDCDGDIEKITIRLIAEKVSVGIGLINYHFESKDKLIEICVQRIIGNVIDVFKPDINKEINPINRLKKVAKLVTDFLIANPSISRISILGDMKTPNVMDNTMKTVSGFLLSMTDYDISMKDKAILIFSMTSILQVVFLRMDISKQCFDFDLRKKEERDNFIDFIIDKLFERNGKDENTNN